MSNQFEENNAKLREAAKLLREGFDLLAQAQAEARERNVAGAPPLERVLALSLSGITDPMRPMVVQLESIVDTVAPRARRSKDELLG